VGEVRLAISRLCCPTDKIDRMSVIAPEDTFIVTLHLADDHHHQFWRRPRNPILAPYFPKDAASIVNLSDKLSANVGGPLEV
jgi:hypothetical protein